MQDPTATVSLDEYQDNNTRATPMYHEPRQGDGRTHKHTLTFMLRVPGDSIPFPEYDLKNPVSKVMRNLWSGNTVPFKTTLEVVGNLTQKDIKAARVRAEERFLDQVNSMRASRQLATTGTDLFETTAEDTNEITMD